jgi:hypothetical protein
VSILISCMIGMIIGWAIGGAIILGAMEIVSRISDAIELRKIKQGQMHNAISICSNNSTKGHGGKSA